MRKESWSVAFACALGALIGTFVSLEIGKHFHYGSFLWIFGALFGGIIAWTIVDFKELCAGVARAYRRTIDWRPDLVYWKNVLLMFGATLSVMSSLVTAVIMGVVTKKYADLSWGDLSFLITPQAFVLTVGTSWFFACGFADNAEIASQCSARQYEKRQNALTTMVLGNPIGILLFILFLVWETAAQLLWDIRWNMRVRRDKGRNFTLLSLAQFVRRAFIYVHSQRRTICFVDATIGATVGYFLGSAIIGASVGAILGVVNYEVVSIRWLKLVPQQTK